MSDNPTPIRNIGDILQRINDRDRTPFERVWNQGKPILDQANELARVMALIDGKHYDEHATYHDTKDHDGQKYWLLAVAAFAMLKDVDLEQVLADLKHHSQLAREEAAAEIRLSAIMR